MRRFSVFVLLAALSVSGAPKKSTAIAPDAVPHAIALFLSDLSRDGARSVTFRATAMGTRFFFQETTGVTVYRFDDGHYIKEEFLRGSTLAKALKKYEKK